MREMAGSRMAAVLLFVAAAGYTALGQYVPPTDAGADPVPDVATLLQWNQCREYLTPGGKDRGCRVDFDMLQTRNGTLPAETHRDIHVPLGTTMRAVVVLWRSSPFAACSLTTSPGPLARDMSSNIGPALAGLAGFAGSLGVLVEGNHKDGANALVEDRLNVEPAPQEIQDEEKVITEALKKLSDDVRPYDELRVYQDDAAIIRKNLLYSYANDQEARLAMTTIETAATHIVAATLPDDKSIVKLHSESEEVARKIKAFAKKHSGDESVQGFIKKVTKQLNEANRMTALPAFIKDLQSTVQKLLDYLENFRAQDKSRHAQGLNPDASVQVLPIALYPEGKVAVTVKCADAVTATALPDSIQFTAYFQKPPVFDISSGVLISMLPGRQVTVQTPYSDPTAPSTCAAATATTPANTSGCSTVSVRRSRPQFMPGVFAEWHPLNFKLPGVHDAADAGSDPRTKVDSWMTKAAPRHALGYVGSLGLAAGFMVNPNSGSAQAEFFEGISFGLQRFVFLAGNHNGRSQNLTPGYTVGAPVAAGTTVPTVNRWSDGLAFGITYRIPLR